MTTTHGTKIENGDKTDNRIDNLQVMQRGEHWHGRGRDKETGRFIAVKDD